VASHEAAYAASATASDGVIRAVVRLVTVLGLIAGGLGATPTARADDAWVLGYWVGYQADLMPVDEIPWSALTHIAVGPMVPRNNGTIDASMFIDPDTATALARRIAQDAIAHGVTPILMIGGGGAEKTFANAAAKHRAKFVKSLVKLGRTLGFQGFDLDYEGNFDKVANQRLFKRLVAALRRASPGAVLTFPAITVTTTFPHDRSVGFYAAIAGALDRVFLQTYGMSGPYEGWVSWHSSPLYAEDSADVCAAEPACKPTSVDFNVGRCLGAGIPPAKLGLGVGFYGTCWTGVTGPDQSIAGATVPASDNDMSYANVVSLYQPLMAAMYDDGAQAAYLSSVTPVGPQGCTFVSYENPESIAAKGAYAKARGLGGTIVWTINQAHRAADDADPDALLGTTFSAFR
jgi:chitinase